MKVWIDTDAGTNVDDEFTLALAARHQSIDLVGVSTVAGNVDLRRRIAEALFEIAGSAGVEVVAGSARPAPEREVMAGHEAGILRGYQDASAAATPAEDDPGPRSEPGSAGALAAAVGRAEPDLVVCIGPLGNAEILESAAPRHARFSVMGGNIGPLPDGRAAEWNWACDPEAVRNLLGSGRQIQVHPWSVTSRLALDDNDLDRLAGGDGLCRSLAASTRGWLAASPVPDKPPHRIVRLHDPVALLGALAPGLVSVEPTRLLVADDGAVTRVTGRPNCNLAVDLDVTRTRRVVLDTILGPPEQ